MLEHGLCGREGDPSRLLKRSRGWYVRLTKLTASHQHMQIAVRWGGSTPSSSSSASCRSSSTLLPPSSSSSSSSSERYPAARAATTTGPNHSGASLATRYCTQSMRISLHHSIMSSCERERKLHACWERQPMRSDPVLIDPAPSLRLSRWNLGDLGARGGSRAKRTEGEEKREKW